MSNMVGAGEYLQAVANQRHAMETSLQHAGKVKAEHQQHRSELSRELITAQKDFAVALLPALDDSHVARAVALSGLTPLLHERPIEARERERAAIQYRIQQIQADPRFQRAELLVHPTTGSLTRQIAELSQNIADVSSVEKKAEHPRLEHLLEEGYGTPEYTGRWWKVSYYSDWRAAGAIAEQFGAKEFSEVREQIVQARTTMGTLSDERKKLQREKGQVEALINEYHGRHQQLGQLDER